MRLGLHVEQRVGVKRQLHQLQQQLATASADLQVGVMCVQQLCLLLDHPAAAGDEMQLHVLQPLMLGCHCMTMSLLYLSGWSVIACCSRPQDVVETSIADQRVWQKQMTQT